jgi:hypothetical protein
VQPRGQPDSPEMLEIFDPSALAPGHIHANGTLQEPARVW